MTLQPKIQKDAHSVVICKDPAPVEDDCLINLQVINKEFSVHNQDRFCIILCKACILEIENLRWATRLRNSVWITRHQYDPTVSSAHSHWHADKGYSLL